jgi:hypothetical protein
MRIRFLRQQSFYIPMKAHIGCVAPLTPHPKDIVTSFPMIKRPEGEAVHPPPYGIKVKNNRSCTATDEYLHVVASNLAQGQSHLYYYRMLYQSESRQHTIRIYVLYGALKARRSEHGCWYEQVLTSPEFIPALHSVIRLIKAMNTQLC